VEFVGRLCVHAYAEVVPKQALHLATQQNMSGGERERERERERGGGAGEKGGEGGRERQRGVAFP
jgi:hypothetical protein